MSDWDNKCDLKDANEIEEWEEWLKWEESEIQMRRQRGSNITRH